MREMIYVLGRGPCVLMSRNNEGVTIWNARDRCPDFLPQNQFNVTWFTDKELYEMVRKEYFRKVDYHD